MADHTDQVRLQLAQGVKNARQLIENIEISQPTLSRVISVMGNEIIRLGAARSIQYALRDGRRGLGDVPVYRVGADGKIRDLGILAPVCPDGFVMRQADGVTLHSDSLPWWLLDMRPQGFIGRAYAARYATTLGLPAQLAEWSDTDVLRALMAHGHDAVGNLLLGDAARDRFMEASAPEPVAMHAKSAAYARLAQDAARGDVPGFSAGGEQPKFLTFAETPDGPRHVLVKFSLPDVNPVTARWCDLLLAEHHALNTLAAAGVDAADSSIIDHEGQRFLEVERFDRVGALGRRGIFSLTAVEAEFVGDAASPWPVIATRLAADGHIAPEAAQGAALLYAFGTLIGNTDMHNGNLSFTSEHGRPYGLAPAYDMLPMGFAPRSGGGLPDTLAPANLRACVDADTWVRALELADNFLDRIRKEARFSNDFLACIDALVMHVNGARDKMRRLG